MGTQVHLRIFLTFINNIQDNAHNNNNIYNVNNNVNNIDNGNINVNNINNNDEKFLEKENKEMILL